MNLRIALIPAALFLSGSLAVVAQTPATGAPTQEAKCFEAKLTIPAKLDYLLSLLADYDKAGTTWPLVLFLHGSGESGNDLSKVKVHGPPKLVESNGPFPFILVSPQSPRGGWNPDVLNALLDALIQQYHVDKDQVYLTVLSMGGFGTWNLAAAHPEKFAAIAPICECGNPADAGKLARIPAWVYHGAKDTTVPPKRSEEMVEALKAAGGNPRFTLYPEAGHDSWTVTYANPDFWTWLLAQKRGG